MAERTPTASFLSDIHEDEEFERPRPQKKETPLPSVNERLGKVLLQFWAPSIVLASHPCTRVLHGQLS